MTATITARTLTPAELETAFAAAHAITHANHREHRRRHTQPDATPEHLAPAWEDDAAQALRASGIRAETGLVHTLWAIAHTAGDD